MKLSMYILLLTTLSISSVFEVSAQLDTNDFVTTWRTYNRGPLGDSTIGIATNPLYSYNFDVDWNNDGIFDSLGVTTDVFHTYPDTGTYTIRIKGQFPSIYVSSLFGSFNYFGPENEKIIGLNQWGNIQWQNLDNAFIFCKKMKYYATDAPDLTSISSLTSTFQKCEEFDGNLSNWDVSNIRSLAYTFAYTNFNSNINNWNVSNVKTMTGTFLESPFNRPLDNWDVSRVLLMDQMFQRTPFNQPINSWTVDSVIDMAVMFKNNKSFNQPLNNWNTASFTSGAGMFDGATSFDQNISNFNFSNVKKQTNFNSSLTGMLDSCGMSRENYDSLLMRFTSYFNLDSVTLGAFGRSYCRSDSERTTLVNRGWNIFGDTLDCIGVGLFENGFSKEELVVYPNPAKNYFNLKMKIYSKKGKVSVLNSKGQLMKEEIINPNLNYISIEDLPNGIYFIRYYNSFEKLVVSK